MSFTPPPDALTITFPQPAPLLNLNKRENRYAKARTVKAWRQAAYWATYATSRAHPLRLAATPCYVRVSLPVPDRRHRDPHNDYTQKPIIDGITDAGMWPNDRPAWVTTVEPELRLDPGGTVTVHIWPREVAS